MSTEGQERYIEIRRDLDVLEGLFEEHTEPRYRKCINNLRMVLIYEMHRVRYNWEENK